MVRRRTFVISCCLFALSLTSAVAQEGIQWAPNLSAAVNMASRENRLVLLHFWAPGCGPCVALERNVFTQPEVAQAIARDFVAVKINAEAMPETARKYRVDRWPMDVIITPAGYPVHSVVSPNKAGEYTQMLYHVASQRRPGSRITSHPADTMGGAASIARNDYRTEPSEQPWDNEYPQDAQGEQFSQFGGSGFASPSQQPPREQPRQPVQDDRYAGDPYSGQPSQFGPSYADPYSEPQRPADARFSPRSQPPAQPAPRETANPYIDNAPREQSGFGPRDPIAEQQPPQRPSQPTGDHPPIGLDGHCPVTLIEGGKWEKGDPKFGIIHRGRLYFFVNEKQKTTFWQDPDRFAPILSGNDPVEFAENGRVVPGSRKHGVFFRNQIYLFVSEASLERFWNSPQRYSDIALQAMARASENMRR